MTQFPKILYAHRGSCLKLPENTTEALEAGLLEGANALEMDVHRTKDDVIVVIHDPDGKRVAGVDEKVKELTYDEVQQWKLGSYGFRVPTLLQVLERFKNVPFNVDIKDPDPKTVKMVVELLMDSGEYARVRVASQNRSVLKMVKDLDYKGPLGMSLLEVAAIKLLPKWLVGQRFKGRAAQVPMRFSIFNFATEAFIEKCHALGLRVDYWVINDLQSAQYLAQIGADGIMSDDPCTVRDWLKEGR